MKRTIKIADLFCGAGGSSTGAKEACEDAGYNCKLTAINHWDVAVDTHTVNHPDARHLCCSLDSVNPTSLYSPGELDILWGSPECTHHSTARGGKPVNEQSRATAWCILRWADTLRPPIIQVENVKEFQTWGPIGSNGKPLRSRRGETFHAWVAALQSLGYRVEWRELCAADYGDPTTRSRLFIQAVRGRRKIIWPEPTHAPLENTDLFGHNRLPYVPAKDIIDWTQEGRSIFGRKRPLAEKTLSRIFTGLERFGLAPFICGAGGPGRAGEPRTVERPVGTVLTRNNSYLAQPFLVHLRGTATTNDVDEPLPTVSAGGTHFGLCEPYLVSACHGSKGGNENHRSRSTDQPLPTITGSNEWAVCQPFIMAIDHQGGNGSQVRDVEVPLGTVTTKQRHALVEPCIIKYYGTGIAKPVSEPLDTVTTKARFGLVQPIVRIDGENYVLDVKFRMLKWRELARAQGFHDEYEFKGTGRDIVKQIGNAVPRNLAKALVSEALKQL